MFQANSGIALVKKYISLWKIECYFMNKSLLFHLAVDKWYILLWFFFKPTAKILVGKIRIGILFFVNISSAMSYVNRLRPASWSLAKQLTIDMHLQEDCQQPCDNVDLHSFVKSAISALLLLNFSYRKKQSKLSST